MRKPLPLSRQFLFRARSHTLQFVRAVRVVARGLLAAWLILAAGSLRAQQPPISAIRWPSLAGAVQPIRRFRLEEPPVFKVGTAQGPEYTLFNGIIGMVRLEHGQFAVGDAGNVRVLFFDSSGGLIKSVGRRGAGPGEYRSPRWLGRCSNGEVAIADGALSRLTLLTSEGDVAGTMTLPPRANFDQPLWCSGTGTLFMLLYRPREPVRHGGVYPIPTALLRAKGAALDTIAKLGIQEFFIGDRVMALTPLPLGRSTLAAAATDHIFACNNDDGACHVFDTLGVELRKFAIPIARRRADDAAWRDALADHFASEPSRELRTLGAALLKEVPQQAAFPVVDEIRADAAGNLWVRTFDNFGTAVSTWVVFSDHGTPLAFVAIPRRLQITEIGRDFVLGFVRDDDGVEQVLGYRLPDIGATARRREGEPR